MRIGYYYPFKAHPPRGGNSLHAWQLIQHMTLLGHRVTTYEDPTPPSASVAETVDEFLAASDVICIRLDSLPLGVLPPAREILERATVPIVLEVNAPANEVLAFSWLAREDRAGSAWHGRAMDRVRRWLHAAKQRPGIAAEERLRTRLARNVSGAICVSECLVPYASGQLGIPRVTVLPNASDPEVMTPEPRGSSPVNGEGPRPIRVLYSGSPKYPWQGLDLMKKVALRSAEMGLDVEFLFVVNQPIDWVASVPNCRQAVSVPYEELASVISSADLCVCLPMDFAWSPWGFHGSPMKLFDYMACARPVLASKVGQLPSIVEGHDCGVLCDYSVDDVIGAIRRLADDEGERVRLGENGRRAVVETYNWAENARRTVEFFEEVRAGTARSPA